MSTAAGQQLLQQIMDDYKNDRLVLPSLPDVAMQVRKAVQGDMKTAGQIAKIIQIDPALTARLIQISNGPLHRGLKPIDGCQTAITRLGFRVTQNLVMSITFRHMFKAKHPQVRERMENAWRKSSRVGAITCVLARITPGLQADRGLMAGIVHDIGLLPILRYADQYPELIEDSEQLDRIIDRLRSPLGTLILRKWKFSDDLASIPQHMNDWIRETGKPPDYTDLVLVARVHAYFGTGETYNGPALMDMPSFKKLTLSELGPGASIEVLNQAQGEIDSISKILSG